MRNRSEEEIISSPRRVTEPFRDALNGDWEGMKRFYEKNREAAVLPLTLTNDTPLHIAVYSGGKSPLEELLRVVPNDHFTRQNDKLNTPLHEAGVIGNVEAAQVLVNRSAAQLDVRNILGETPMFRAAAFGVTKMVQYLAAEVRRVQGDMDVQRLRDDGTSILHIAIYGQHFGPLALSLSICFTGSSIFRINSFDNIKGHRHHRPSVSRGGPSYYFTAEPTYCFTETYIKG